MQYRFYASSDKLVKRSVVTSTKGDRCDQYAFNNHLITCHRPLPLVRSAYVGECPETTSTHQTLIRED